jgi:hypothetical protein
MKKNVPSFSEKIDETSQKQETVIFINLELQILKTNYNQSRMSSRIAQW